MSHKIIFRSPETKDGFERLLRKEQKMICCCCWHLQKLKTVDKQIALGSGALVWWFWEDTQVLKVVGSNPSTV